MGMLGLEGLPFSVRNLPSNEGEKQVYSKQWEAKLTLTRGLGVGDSGRALPFSRGVSGPGLPQLRGGETGHTLLSWPVVSLFPPSHATLRIR